jgi:hypothetical protein
VLHAACRMSIKSAVVGQSRKLLGQAVLERAEGALGATTRLERVVRDVLYTGPSEGRCRGRRTGGGWRSPRRPLRGPSSSTNQDHRMLRLLLPADPGPEPPSFSLTRCRRRVATGSLSRKPPERNGTGNSFKTLWVTPAQAIRSWFELDRLARFLEAADRDRRAAFPNRTRVSVADEGNRHDDVRIFSGRLPNSNAPSSASGPAPGWKRLVLEAAKAAGPSSHPSGLGGGRSDVRRSRDPRRGDRAPAEGRSFRALPPPPRRR